MTDILKQFDLLNDLDIQAVLTLTPIGTMPPFTNCEYTSLRRYAATMVEWADTPLMSHRQLLLLPNGIREYFLDPNRKNPLKTILQDKLSQEDIGSLLARHDTLKYLVYMYAIDHIFFMPKIIELHNLGYVIKVQGRGTRLLRAYNYSPTGYVVNMERPYTLRLSGDIKTFTIKPWRYSR